MPFDLLGTYTTPCLWLLHVQVVGGHSIGDRVPWVLDSGTSVFGFGRKHFKLGLTDCWWGAPNATWALDSSWVTLTGFVVILTNNLCLRCFEFVLRSAIRTACLASHANSSQVAKASLYNHQMARKHLLKQGPHRPTASARCQLLWSFFCKRCHVLKSTRGC